MKYLLVSVYQVCSNESPRVKIGLTPWVIDFPNLLNKNPRVKLALPPGV
jgi:hypothetical protein